MEEDFKNEKKSKVIEILLEQNFITDEDAQRALQSEATGHMSAEDFLFSEDILTKDLIGQAMAEFYKVKYIDLNSKHPVKDVVLRLPKDIAEEYNAIVFVDDKTGVTVTTDKPNADGLEEAIKSVFTGKKVKITYSIAEDIAQILLYYRKPLYERLNNIAAEEENAAPLIVDEVLKDAVMLHASDVHFEPQEEKVLIRFRIDGLLKPMVRLSKPQYESVLNRMKVMAHLRTDQHLSTQDGSIRFKLGRDQVDIRMSIAPVFDGEKVALRLLSSYAKSFALGDLGFSDRNRDIIIELSEKPFGMILITGPTGSGKTTTLYGILKKMNQPDVNITTIEDPVEYKIAGVNHIQVNEATELTFARGLRSIVRQDPDIILVGEIRDKETSEISVNAALTGHLLLSTFHANDAATSIPRLLDMGTEAFLLSSTLEAIISQRLVRKICDHCRYSEDYNIDDIAKKFPTIKKVIKTKRITLYKGKGCDVCGYTGYSGRTGIFEIILATPEFNSLILNSPTTQQIWELARNQGSISMYEDGIQKVMQGVTTLEELERVVSPPKNINYVDQKKVYNKKSSKVKKAGKSKTAEEGRVKIQTSKKKSKERGSKTKVLPQVKKRLVKEKKKK